jgi:hypothetical protein
MALLPPESSPVEAVSQTVGISVTTLERWRARDGGDEPVGAQRLVPGTRGCFAELDAARQWAGSFVHWYNNEHRHSGIGYVTPAQRHAGQDRALLSARHELYLQARRSNPRRWSGKTRDWTPITAVTLNPEQDTVIEPAASRNPLSSSTEAPAFPSRPDNARSTARNRGDGRRAARRVSMARMASTGPSPKGEPWHTQCLSVDQVINASPGARRHRRKQGRHAIRFRTGAISASPCPRLPGIPSRHRSAVRAALRASRPRASRRR